jgi:hypothetical protein
MSLSQVMNSPVVVLDEPLLQFADGQSAIDPHDGLGLFGPYSAGSNSPFATPAYIAVGTIEGNARFQQWSEAMNHRHASADAKKHRLWSPYPGFDVAFAGQWQAQPLLDCPIDREQLLMASRKRDPHERCFSVVEMFVDQIEKAKEKAQKLDRPIGVAICVIPDEVWANCRPKSIVLDPSDDGISSKTKESRKRGQQELFAQFNADQYHLSPDFRRQLKARTMRFDIPLQIVRESTLRLSDDNVFGERGLTPLSDRMWNLASALYYKCGGKPWKLHSAREGVCYVGLAFRRADEHGRTACCAAQMFLDTGDGIVFLGEYGPWYSPESKQFHLEKDAAKRLLSGILATYDQLDGKPLTEIFLHCRSSINAEEFAGYREACPDGCKLVGIRVRTDRFGPRLYRTAGAMPVIRGTFWRINDRAGYLYASGFKPRLATYDGWETPLPLRIDVQHGEAPIEQVASDILGLTKLNYNACRLGESQPVTVGFSQAVGEILISNPTVTDRRPNFKYYI